MPGIIASLLGSVDSILGVRDNMGAATQPIHIVTRTWYADAGFTTNATQVGEGYPKDTQVALLPSPGIKNFSQNIHLREGGAVQQGDIILANVSKNKYPTKDSLMNTTAQPNVELFYLVNDKLYTVINVAEKYITWDVQIRELSNQTRY